MLFLIVAIEKTSLCDNSSFIFKIEFISGIDIDWVNWRLRKNRGGGSYIAISDISEKHVCPVSCVSSINELHDDKSIPWLCKNHEIRLCARNSNARLANGTWLKLNLVKFIYDTLDDGNLECYIFR